MATPDHAPAASPKRTVDTGPTVDLTSVSLNCHEGRHTRCLGTVYAWPHHLGDPALLDCACPVEDCGHGSAYVQAQRNKARASRKRRR